MNIFRSINDLQSWGGHSYSQQDARSAQKAMIFGGQNLDARLLEKVENFDAPIFVMKLQIYPINFNLKSPFLALH